MNSDKIKKIESKVIVRLDKVLSLSVFDEPRPKYISKITITDKFFAATILKLFPYSVRPNFLTVFRFITIPFVIFLLLTGDYITSFWLFTISALSDALDGALARTRHQITDWGIVFDPVADKLLVGFTALIIISKAISPFIAGTIIALEIILVISAYWRFKGKLIPAKTSGKLKMIAQCVGVSLLLLALAVGSPFLIQVATYIIYASIVGSLLSLFVYRSI
jgi:CDP-diacylglycerol--glycerol-3-phosphate 3-phosphatidyltransferase